MMEAVSWHKICWPLARWVSNVSNFYCKRSTNVQKMHWI